MIKYISAATKTVKRRTVRVVVYEEVVEEASLSFATDSYLLSLDQPWMVVPPGMAPAELKDSRPAILPRLADDQPKRGSVPSVDRAQQVKRWLNSMSLLGYEGDE